MLIPFIDIESTGLCSTKDWLLEVGVSVVDMPSGEEVFADSALIYYPPKLLLAKREECDPYVRDMHDRGGLWADLQVRENTVDRDKLDSWLCTIGQLWSPDKPPIANFNAPFDRNWLSEYAPEFVSTCLNHRCFDLSSAREMVRLVYPSGFGPQAGAGKHRALDDAREAVAYWKWFRSHIMTPYGRGSGGDVVVVS